MYRFISLIKIALLCLALGSGVSSAQSISVEPVPEIDGNLVGIISPIQAGIPKDFLESSEEAALVTALLKQPDHHFFTLRKFIQRLSLAELKGPQGGKTKSGFLAARLDFLLSQGAVDEADALLQKAQVDTAPLFQRWFEVQLYLEDPINACAPLQLRPELSDAIDVSIYCHAINKDWFAAELLLVNALELDRISKSTGDLLSVFLEPELLDEIVLDPVPSSAAILALTIAEALDLPRQSSNLPISFLHRDLSENIGWLPRLRAAERLTRTGALAPRYLSELYAEGVASASGALWDRVRGTDNLKAALATNDNQLICKELLKTLTAFHTDAMVPIFSRIFAEELALHPLAGTECIGAQIFTILLHPKRSVLLFDLAAELDDKDILTALVREDFEKTATNGPLEKAVRAAFRTPLSSKPKAVDILTATVELQEGRNSDPRQLQKTLTLLRAAELEEVAINLALEVVVLDRLDL